MGPPRLSPRGELLLNRARQMARLGRPEMGALKIAQRPAPDSPGGLFVSCRARLMLARVTRQRNLPGAIAYHARLMLARFIQQCNLPEAIAYHAPLMLARITRQRNLLEAIAYHEAGYLVAASVAQVPVQKSRCNVIGLRRCASHVLDLDAITELEDVAAAVLVMLAGAAALRRYDASTSGSDEVEASFLLFNGLLAHVGGTLKPAHVRSHMRFCAELAAQAETLVAERWCEIQGEAARLHVEQRKRIIREQPWLLHALGRFALRQYRGLVSGIARVEQLAGRCRERAVNDSIWADFKTNFRPIDLITAPAIIDLLLWLGLGTNFRTAFWGGFIPMFVVSILYMLPAYIAEQRNHVDKWEIFGFNLLLGWTVIGWIDCLVWSLSSPAAGTQRGSSRGWGSSPGTPSRHAGSADNA